MWYFLNIYMYFYINIHVHSTYVCKHKLLFWMQLIAINRFYCIKVYIFIMNHFKLIQINKYINTFYNIYTDII